MYIYNGILFNREEGGYSAICDNIHEPWAHNAKISKTEKDKYFMISPTCGIYTSQINDIQRLKWWLQGGWGGVWIKHVFKGTNLQWVVNKS